MGLGGQDKGPFTQGQARLLFLKDGACGFCGWSLPGNSFSFSLSNDRSQAHLSPHRLGRVVHRAFARHSESETAGETGWGESPEPGHLARPALLVCHSHSLALDLEPSSV